jgi:Flp pilus assembly pilin Flp
MAEKPIERPSDRGATLVEYALLVALFGLVVVGGTRVLQDRARDRYERTGAAITEVAGVVIEHPPDGDGDEDPDDDTPSPTPTVSKSCPSNRSCSFNLTNAPPGVSFVWASSIGGSSAGSGSGSSHSASLPNGPGTYSVTFTWATGQASGSASCGNGGSACG